MLFLYDQEDILAYCCHEEEPINFQSLSQKNGREEKRKSSKRNKQSRIVMHCSHEDVLHTVVHTQSVFPVYCVNAGKDVKMPEVCAKMPSQITNNNAIDSKFCAISNKQKKGHRT